LPTCELVGKKKKSEKDPRLKTEGKNGIGKENKPTRKKSRLKKKKAAKRRDRPGGTGSRESGIWSGLNRA